MASSGSLRSIVIGSLCIAFGELLFSTNDALVKLSSMQESQCLYGRFGIQLFIAICWWFCNKPKDSQNWYGDKPYILNIWFRGIAYTINTIAIWYAVIRLPIGDAMCIYYQGPIIIAILASIFLKEPLPKLTPLIFVFAMIGIMLISQPTFIIILYYQIFETDNKQNIKPLNIDGLFAAFLALSKIDTDFP